MDHKQKVRMPLILFNRSFYPIKSNTTTKSYNSDHLRQSMMIPLNPWQKFPQFLCNSAFWGIEIGHFRQCNLTILLEFLPSFQKHKNPQCSLQNDKMSLVPPVQVIPQVLWYDMISFKMHYQNLILYDKSKNAFSEIDVIW